MTSQQPGGISRLRWNPDTSTFTTASPRRRWWKPLLVVAIAVIVMAGIRIHNQVEGALHRIISEDLQTILATDIAALEFWMGQERGIVDSWAEDEKLQQLSQSLQQQATTSADPPQALQSAREQARLRKLLDPLLDPDSYQGYALVNSAGLVLSAAKTDEQIIGQQLTPQGLAGLNSIFTEQGGWIQPFWRGQYLYSQELQKDSVLMGVAALLPSGNSQARIALLLFIPPEKDFTRILSIARMGESGDTYAFDENGRMLSDTRHLESLKAHGILPDSPAVRAMLRIELRDPGGNLLRGFSTDTPMAARPLTRLIATALADDTKKHAVLERYRDYRGVPVVGAARWIPGLGFGVATEVNAAEAFGALRPIEVAFWIFSALLLTALAGLVVFSIIVSRLGRRMEEIRQLGQYTLEEKIGEGGMGKVYMARHALLRRPTAIKLISGARIDEENLQRFEHEVQLTSQLTHPNTIEVYDYGHTRDGVFYYVMEYLPGIDLGRLIEEDGAIPANRAAHILCQVCGSLGEAHARGFIHRDIKPANIILTERGNQLDFAKVLDFGLVKDMNQASEHTVADAIPGTPPYIAPERLSNPLDIDCRSDLYSVGAVAFNLLTGKQLFEGSSSMDIAYQVVANPAPRMSEFVSIDAALDQLVADCLERDPEARPQTAQAIIDQLQAIIGTDTWEQADARRWWDQHPGWLARDTGGN